MTESLGWLLSSSLAYLPLFFLLFLYSPSPLPDNQPCLPPPPPCSSFSFFTLYLHCQTTSLAYLPLFFLLFLYSLLDCQTTSLAYLPLFFLLFLYSPPRLPDNQPCLSPPVLPSLSLLSSSTARQPALLTSPWSSFSFFTLHLHCQTTSLAYLPLFFLLFLYSPPPLPDNQPCLPPLVLPSLSLLSSSTARQPALLTSPCSSFSFFTLLLTARQPALLTPPPPPVLPSLSLPSTSTARQQALHTSPCSSFSFFTLFLDCQTTSLAYLPLFFLLFLYSPSPLPDNQPCLPPLVLPSLSLLSSSIARQPALICSGQKIWLKLR